jgi:hypothetical protein
METSTMTTTAEMVEQEIAGMQEDIAKERAECPDPVPDFLMPMFASGHWLGAKLEASGATEKEREDACFAFGQRACMAGVAGSYELAARCYDNWMRGRKDTPGAELAHELVDEVLQT